MENSYHKNKIKFGQHLIFDAYGCDFEALNNKDVCTNALEDMVRLAKMHKLREPIIIHADGNETLGGKDPGGYSGFVIIEESHISIHSFAKRGFLTIDLYSCKEFETADVIDYLIETFKPKDYDIIKMDRGLKYPADNIYK